MTAGKSDVVRKRLTSAGLSAEAITKYIETLRAFLSARLTKSRYEDEMSKVLPKDKIHVHNAILHDILFRAQQRREGVRELPLVTPLKEKRVARREHKVASSKGGVATQAKSEPKIKLGTKRVLEDVESETRTNGVSDNGTGNTKKIKRAIVPKKGGECSKLGSMIKTKSGAIDKASPKSAKRKGEATVSLPPPSPSPSMSAVAGNAQRLGAGTRLGTIGGGEIGSYDGLPYFPTCPGQAMDFEVFLKVRQRVRRIAVEQLGMNGVKDDAVALIVHGLELHVKTLMEGAARQRAARDGRRAQRNVQCGAVRAFDLREAALRNVGVLGDEGGMELERLLMLL